MFEKLDDAAIVTTITDSARAENRACAHRLAAIAELYERRQIPVEDGQGRELWRIDPWESVAAEVAAAQGITAAAAGAQLHNAICLHERLPKVAALFATGTINYRTVSMIVARTLLALEPDIMAAIDAELAEALLTWGPLSLHKTEQAIDALVERHDPAARRRTESVVRSRYVDVEQRGGIASLSGEVYSTDATLLDRRLTALAHTVCDDDPRTVDQRRADALGALAAGHTTLTCACGGSDCPAGQTPTAASVVVHVVAEAAALDAASADLHGERPGDGGPEIVRDPERLAELIREATGPGPSDRPGRPPTRPVPNPALVLGGPVIPAQVLADLAARGAVDLRPLIHPGDSPPEPRYRPSAALADFIRCRDMTCRFPGCDRPADVSDIDHTIPYGRGGPTHASNLKCLCRKHHLLKTFWPGPGGWRDEQLPDGTVIWTSPSGHTYRTVPGSRLLVPALSLPTAVLPPQRGAGVGHAERGAMMPKRRRPRATDRLHRIMAERNRNQRHQPIGRVNPAGTRMSSGLRS
ncbi:DUF222 domain-containing protein [Mycobacterium heidelbergense]|uniref:Uncharacterized protein n=1 Tax=Mycobacterium heidelbergense TaxID=53376 RepID=A0A1X0DPE8_MYCHE|nr:HNH endonuclease signature motif containing protein [Mycobacterium heidelbergense]MCV7049196.1 DUF222 domain-containing protein [Mycobacterium heidelbergense]ORA74225.1 hypothetical protein BST25_10530 [Mycobacterium heidelbergense]BBZ49464.1 hypothetical protein MHEI_11810 [Mycobacterium heidelbergense]